MLSQHIHNKSTKFRVGEVRSSVESSSESNSNFKSQMILTIHFSDLVNKRSEKFRFRLIKQHQGELIKEYVIRLQEGAQKWLPGERRHNWFYEI